MVYLVTHGDKKQQQERKLCRPELRLCDVLYSSEERNIWRETNS